MNALFPVEITRGWCTLGS